MAKRVQVVLVLLVLCVGTSASAQVEGSMRATGHLIVNGTPSRFTTTIFVNDTVDTDTQTSASLASRGNRVVFTPNSRFLAQQNAFRLDSGGTKVATYTQLTTHLPDCFSVAPVSNYLMTLYEVNWSGTSALVYARSQDIKITGAGREWIVKEGQTARIDEVRLCKPLVYVWPQSSFPGFVVGERGAFIFALVGTVAPPIIALDLWDKRNMSPDHP